MKKSEGNEGNCENIETNCAREVNVPEEDIEALDL